MESANTDQKVLDLTGIDLKKTVNLPQTSFPMKANLAQLEPKLLEQWEKSGIYERIRQAREGQPTYILHDGPPYANGNIHLGHAFNKLLKDFIVRLKNMEGFDSPYVPGWDCHGLPIEIKVDGQLGSKKAGMSAAQVLLAATSGNARIFHIEDRVGSVKVGLMADLVAVDGDPTRDITAVRNTDVVVCRGTVYLPAELFTASGMQPR